MSVEPRIVPSDTTEGLWVGILASTRALSFPEYAKFIDGASKDLAHSGTTAYQTLKGATQRFLKEARKRDALVELIWSYWHEEAMLVRTLQAICERFQNQLAPGSPDPLQGLALDPLRPLTHLLWGYIRDEPDRINVLRRAHEYEHQYGISRQGKVLESFHDLLKRSVTFFRQDDDTTRAADGFPVLNGLEQTHLAIAERAHDQYGDLPGTARVEMLTEMWLLSRPEMREFLPNRTTVVYPEAWMDRVDHMNSLQGWTDVSVVHFHDLAVFGEQLLLSIRFDAWSARSDPSKAAAWARFWRQEVQGYVHAYRASTGVDLSTTD